MYVIHEKINIFIFSYMDGKDQLFYNESKTANRGHLDLYLFTFVVDKVN